MRVTLFIIHFNPLVLLFFNIRQLTSSMKLNTSLTCSYNTIVNYSICRNLCFLDLCIRGCVEFFILSLQSTVEFNMKVFVLTVSRNRSYFEQSLGPSYIRLRQKRFIWAPPPLPSSMFPFHPFFQHSVAQWLGCRRVRFDNISVTAAELNVSYLICFHFTFHSRVSRNV